MNVRADADTQIYFQIGKPLDFSCAAALHNAVFEYANLNAISLNLHVEPGTLAEFCEAIKTIKVGGFDITMPYKSDIIPYLDVVDDISRDFTCVNHGNLRDGKLIGICLDGTGMCMAIEDAGVDISGKTALILGAGGVAGPIAAELVKRGAKKIIVLNRTVSKAEYIEEVLHKHFDVETAVGSLTYDNMKKYCAESQIVVQCTCLGMDGHEGDFEDVTFIDALPEGAAVADVLYTPDRTKILAYAESKGYTVLNGLGMLINQQKAMLKFHFDLDAGDDIYDFAEEGLMVARAQRNARANRLKRAGTPLETK
ncbi:MAG: shikimate dehydrogenase [Christensenellaceae bacterium]|nr:shikimate dehydrogenase [Christensenellaceae bacterium]